MRKKEVKAKVLRVRVPIEEVGLLSALIDGLGRVALARTREKGKGEVDLIAPPQRFTELLKAVEGMKKHVRDLEIVGEVHDWHSS